MGALKPMLEHPLDRSAPSGEALQGCSKQV
jgi:hypothetical protein